MSRRATIYIRTSSETQGKKSSPLEQEADCRHLAQEKGLEVVVFIGMWRNIGLVTYWSNPRGVIRIALI